MLSWRVTFYQNIIYIILKPKRELNVERRRLSTRPQQLMTRNYRSLWKNWVSIQFPESKKLTWSKMTDKSFISRIPKVFPIYKKLKFLTTKFASQSKIKQLDSINTHHQSTKLWKPYLIKQKTAWMVKNQWKSHLRYTICFVI